MKKKLAILIAALTAAPGAAQAVTLSCVADGGVSCSDRLPDYAQRWSWSGSPPTKVLLTRNGTIDSTLSVPTGVCDSVSDLNLSVNMVHGRVGDLRLTLTHQASGRNVVVLDQPGIGSGSPNGCDGDDLNATFNDEATGAAAQQACGSTIPSIAGSLTPNAALSAFDGVDAAGSWELKVEDLAAGDMGALEEWSITMLCNGGQDLPGELQLVQPTVSVTEGGNAVLTVNRLVGQLGSVSVDYAAASGSATSGSDFPATSGTLTWPDGDMTAKSITLPITIDQAIEPIETFTVTLSNPQGGATLLPPVTATVYVSDSPGLVQFSAGTVTGDELAGKVDLTVNRVGGAGGAVTVEYATANGSAIAGSDYTTTTGTLTWNDGDAGARTVRVPLIYETAIEGTEIFTMDLANPTGGAALGVPSQTVITINDGLISGCLEAHQHPCVAPIGGEVVYGDLPITARAGTLLCRICYGLDHNANIQAYDAMKCAEVCPSSPTGGAQP